MRVAIMGCGEMGAALADAAVVCGHEIVACGDPVQTRAKKLARKWKAGAGTDCRELIRRKDVDAVVVAAPTPCHAEHIRWAARARKPVFCAPPLARTVAEAKGALAAAKRADAKVFVGHVTRYTQAFAGIVREAASGKIGEVGFIRTHRGRPCPRGAKNWYRDFAQSGGAVFDLLLDDLDWIQGAFGPPERVFCQNLQASAQAPFDYALVTLKLKSGAIAQLVASWAERQAPRVTVELCGDAGMIQYDSALAPIQLVRASGAGRIETSDPVSPTPLQEQWQEFTAWVEGGQPPRVGTDAALLALKTAEGALRSAVSGRAVTLG